MDVARSSIFEKLMATGWLARLIQTVFCRLMKRRQPAPLCFCLFLKAWHSLIWTLGTHHAQRVFFFFWCGKNRDILAFLPEFSVKDGLRLSAFLPWSFSPSPLSTGIFFPFKYSQEYGNPFGPLQMSLFHSTPIYLF